ncbi:uncharacterized protein LMH87_007580 [Akanthomyces muscarius]|uniref:Uncharacterized protein n=1 Tax=Akanthomyces muscarius TaxID=2231603 RepID=A0A9W8UR80_AKAMU|nr:uncharacterized protein LMH87_007580 [Akanthomyces muscarius]KAJ4161546.1 hypothetical protein LMH87_007580 [Akanthomyces muscarius]
MASTEFSAILFMTSGFTKFVQITSIHQPRHDFFESFSTLYTDVLCSIVSAFCWHMPAFCTHPLPQLQEMFEYKKLDTDDPELWKNLDGSSGTRVDGTGQKLRFKNCGLDVYKKEGGKEKHDQMIQITTGECVVPKGVFIVIVVGDDGGFRVIS